MIIQHNGNFCIFNIKKRNNSKYLHIWNAKYGKSLNIKKVNTKNKILNYIK